jgi:hypothetical protein
MPSRHFHSIGPSENGMGMMTFTLSSPQLLLPELGRSAVSASDHVFVV